MSPLFEISNADLGYQGNTVLHISDLSIKSGALTFVTGPSGVGKSTLLETLGLMTNTLAPSSKTVDFNSSSKTYSLKDLWKASDSARSEVRNQYLSFIFQATNLMPNFSLGENMCFTGLMNGWTFEKSKKEALAVMDELNLEHSLFDKPISAASGGQRQRISFVRAFCKQFDVLLGDEPTGNLDDTNGRALFEMLKRRIKSDNKSAIIVSHHQAMANEFADEIIAIELRESKSESGDGINQMGWI